jgi:alpha-beta hydrolase superfamily lysophospholipase
MANVDRRVIDGLYHEVFNEPVGLELVDDVVAWLEPHIG